MPNIGEVWGYEGPAIESLEDGEYGFFLASNICGKLRGLGRKCDLSPTTDLEEFCTESAHMLIKSLETTWLCTVPDTWEPSNLPHPHIFVDDVETRAMRLHT